MITHRKWPGVPRLVLLVTLLIGAGIGVAAETRTVAIIAPTEVTPGSEFTVIARAHTSFGEGEQVGFFQLEASLDGARTWVPMAYLDNRGGAVNETITLKAGAHGSNIRVRLRVAFRDGLAGDVDYTGAAIRWDQSWEQWRDPPAKSVVIRVVAGG
jgi:hypothetical protein